MAQRRKIQLGDGYQSVFNFVIGVLTGEVINGFGKLLVLGAWGYIWILAIFVVSLALVLISTEFLFDLIDRFVFGIKRSGHREPLSRRPLARVISLPIGLGVGMVLAQLGLSVVGFVSL